MLAELDKLPDGRPDDRSPFLRIRVLVSSIDPLMRQQIEVALENKAVRLANIDTVSTSKMFGDGTDVMTFDEFREMKPDELINDIYMKRRGEKMPDNLKILLSEILEEIKE